MLYICRIRNGYGSFFLDMSVRFFYNIFAIMKKETNDMSKKKVDYQAFMNLRNGFHGFIDAVGFKLTAMDDLYAKAEIELKDMHRNPIGSVHGGVVYTLADTVGGACSNTTGVACTTLSGNMNYLNPAMNCERLIGEATAIKVGKRIAVIQVMITNEFGKDIAHATMTYQFLPDMPFPFPDAIIEGE